MVEEEEEEERSSSWEEWRGSPLFMLAGSGLVGALFYLGSFALIGGFLEEEAEVKSKGGIPLSEGFQSARNMPSQWDRRYYRQSETAGLELLLLRRTGVRGQWICVRPDNSIAKVNLQRKGTVAVHPLAPVTYVPASALAVPMREMLMGQAAQVHAGTLACPTLEDYRAGRRGWWRALVVLAACPSSVAQTMRWCLRSRWRAAGGLVFLYMVHEGLEFLGVFAMISRLYDMAVATYTSAHAVAAEAESAWSSGLAMIDAGWSFLEFFGEPRRVLMYGLGLCIILRALGDQGHEDDETSSTDSSIGLPATPPESPRVSAGVLELKPLLEAQTVAIADLRVKHEELQQGIEESRQHREADMLLRRAEDERRREWRESDRREIGSLASRLEAFQEALGKSGSSGSWAAISGHGGAEEAEVTEGTPKKEKKVSLAEATAEAATGEGESPENKGVHDIIHRLQRRAELPQAVFLEAVREWREVPEQEWAMNFPPGFRTRVAAEFLSEVYSSGTTAEKWARSFILQRSAGKSHAIKELIPTMMAIDTMILVDREPGILNRVAMERLARKALGIVEAWRKVESETDWNKPASAGKAWKSKVNYEEARRIDPSLVDESLFKLRKLEDEVRHETEREANILKARNKLDKHREGE